MTPRRSSPSLTLASLNANGLNSAAKRHRLFSAALARTDGVEVLMLQETHCGGPAVAECWVQGGAGPGHPWDGHSAWASRTPASCGTAILVHPAVCLDAFQQVASCPEGRYVGALLSLASSRFLVFSVYAPSVGADREAFFQGSLRAALVQTCEAHPGAQLVVGGDFNCIESAALDQVACGRAGGGGSLARTVGFARGLLPLQEELGLLDSFRAVRPRERAFTHVATSRDTAARLDRVLLADSLAPLLAAAGISSFAWPGDHRLSWARVALAHAIPRGPGGWAMPGDVLGDPAFVSATAALFEAWFTARPLGASLSAGERWERFKLFARDRIQLFCLQRGRRQKEERARGVRRAAAAADRWAGRPDSAAAADAWAAARQQLEREAVADAERAARLAGVVWEEWGETSTAFFHRLAGARRAECSIARLDVPGREGRPAATVSLSRPDGRAAAAQCIADYYDGALPGGLFRPRTTCPAAQQLLLGCLDRVLSPEDRAACEAPVTAEGLREALARCARGKVPGGDGLPYEFYVTFWPVLSVPLTQVFNEALDRGTLPPSMLLGIVVLVYKGAKAGPRSQVQHYRPLTMLNSDYKLLAKLFACRFSRPLASVVDHTQTAFVPGRWIGDNVLMHLEEIDYLEASGQPGVVAFLDFEKAYDVTDRGWVMQCLAGLGFGPLAGRWVGLLLAGTLARVRYNGFHTRDFVVRSGVAQGSPLSPALFLIASQPLAARMRQLQATGAVAGIQLPDGTLAPPSQQHADDTTLHLRSLVDLTAAYALALRPFCEASASRANARKTSAMLLGSAAVGVAGAFTHRATGVLVVGRDQAVRHLGVQLGPGVAGEAARAAKFAAVAGVVRQRIAHWTARALSPDGRAHVALQCLASTLVFHATFSRPPLPLLRSLHTDVVRFVLGGDALACPCREVAHLPRALGGRGVPNLLRMTDALQAGVAQRLLHPARRPWKSLMLSRMPCMPGAAVGPRVLLVAGGLGPALPPRLQGYVEGFQACMPHRLVPPVDMLPHSVLAEPLFGNPSVGAGQGPLAPTAFPLAAAAGVHAVADVVAALRRQPPPSAGLQGELVGLAALLPPSWGALLPPAAMPPQVQHEWWELAPAAGGAAEELARVLPGAAVAVVHAVGPDGALAETARTLPWPPPAGRPTGRPCLVVSAPARTAGRRLAAPGLPHDGPPAAAGGPTRPMGADVGPQESLFLVGPWEGGGTRPPLDPTQWGLGGVPVLRSTTGQRTSTLLQADVAGCGKASAAGFQHGLGMRPAVWDGADLAVRELRWVAGAAPPAAGRGRSRAEAQQAVSGLAASAAGLRPARPRLHPYERAQLRQEQELDRVQRVGAAAGGTGGASGGAARRRRPWYAGFDVARGGVPPPAAAAPPWVGAWRRLHRVPAPRQHRLLAWQVLHAVLPCRARLAAWDAGAGGGRVRGLHAGRCHRPGCDGYETLTHVFLECEVARLVTGWAGDLWQAVTGLPPPPRTVPVFLAGDRRAWDPGGGGRAEFWGALRLAVMHYLWSARCRGQTEGRALPAVAVVAQVVHHLRARIRGDAIRAFCSPTAYAVVGCEWLPPRPPLGEHGFHARWGHGGVLCSGESLASLEVHLSLVHPVPPPPRPVP
jgi:exonuclease III